jgi:hypothetical protein
LAGTVVGGLYRIPARLACYTTSSRALHIWHAPCFINETRCLNLSKSASLWLAVRTAMDANKGDVFT